MASAQMLLLSGALSCAFAFSNTEQLQSLNDTARAAYAAGKARMLAQRGPVLLVGADITLLQPDGTRTSQSIIPPLYTNLKTVGHVALGLICLLEGYLDDPAAQAEAWRPPLQKLRDETAGIVPILGTFGFDADALARSQFILARALTFMDATLASGTFTRDALTATARAMAPFLLAHAAEAARAQVDLIHAVVEQLRAGPLKDDWNEVRVFILGPRMPRADNLQFNYFRNAMGQAAVDDRLIYAENVFDEAGALSLLGTILTDRRLSILTFQDEMRMDRDLLGDGGEAYLLELFGALGRRRP